MTKTELAVGDSTWIELIFNVGHISYSTHKLAMVETNDSTSQNFNVSISFDAKGWLPADTNIRINLNPTILDFGPLGKERKTEMETRIQNLSSEELALAIVDSPPGFFQEVKLYKHEIKPRETTKLKVRLKREAEDQRFQKSITLTATGKNIIYRFSVPIQKGFVSEGLVKKPGSPDKDK